MHWHNYVDEPLVPNLEIIPIESSEYPIYMEWLNSMEMLMAFYMKVDPQSLSQPLSTSRGGAATIAYISYG
jgi:hypothetical protein